MDEEKCEHELNLVDENWMSGKSVMATAECQKCKARFRGLMVEQ